MADVAPGRFILTIQSNMTKRPGKLFLGRKVLLPLVAAGMSALTGVASANPTGGVVQAGNITITDVAGLTTFTQGDMGGIVNWQYFSIVSLETDRFIRPAFVEIPPSSGVYLESPLPLGEGAPAFAGAGEGRNNQPTHSQ